MTMLLSFVWTWIRRGRFGVGASALSRVAIHEVDSPNILPRTTQSRIEVAANVAANHPHASVTTNLSLSDAAVAPPPEAMSMRAPEVARVVRPGSAPRRRPPAAASPRPSPFRAGDPSGPLR